MNNNQAKTTAVAGIAGSVVTLALAVAGHFGITVDQSVSDALLTLLMAGVGLIAHMEGTPKAPAALEPMQ